MASESIFKPDVLKGKTVLVTGGGTGIGFGICTMLGLHGANVALASRKKDVIDKACQELESQGIKCLGLTLDVRDESVCQSVADAVAKKFGAIDVLVNNAAGNFMTSIEELTLNGFKTVLDIDLLGCYNMSKAVLPHMKQNGDGCIINITATLSYKASPFQMHAAAAKAAIKVLTQTIGVEWGEYGIRSVSIAPGPIEETAGGPTGRVFGGDGGKALIDPKMTMPIGRFGTKDDIANMVLFLSTPAGSGITATEIVVDGGHWHDTLQFYKRAKPFISRKSKDEKVNYKGGVKATTSKL